MKYYSDKSYDYNWGKIASTFFFGLLFMSSELSLATDFEKTKWIVFFYLKPNSVPMPTTFIITKQNGTEIQGTIGTPFDEQKSFEKGMINRTKDGFEFRIVISSTPGNEMVYSGEILPISEDYLPKNEHVRTAFNIIKSEKNNKIRYKIANGIVYYEKGFPSLNVKSFKNGSGFIFLQNTQ